MRASVQISEHHLHQKSLGMLAAVNKRAKKNPRPTVWGFVPLRDLNYIAFLRVAFLAAFLRVAFLATFFVAFLATFFVAVFLVAFFAAFFLVAFAMNASSRDEIMLFESSTIDSLLVYCCDYIRQ